jgi:lipopolysaccharide transport system ATP-binding protein
MSTVELKGISKRYRLGVGHEGIREVITNSFRRNLRGNSSDQKNQYIWAINNINLKINEGETVGVIGPNGAGKTTILKIISKVTQPTTGTVTVNGRVSALIELGAGFHPDLTGRENIYLNGAILGMSRQEIRKRFDEIVEFSELEEFIDTPVKRFSSGMYARLGFAVAAHVNPDILLVDEVLSVGDESFQIKCRDFIHSFVKSGKTSIFVSHNMYAIDQLCHRVILLDRGRISKSGRASEVLKEYLDQTDQRILQMKQAGKTFSEDKLIIEKFRLNNEFGNVSDSFKSGEDIIVSLDYRALTQDQRLYFVIYISQSDVRASLFAANMMIDNHFQSNVNDQGSVSCRFVNVPLMPRSYDVWVEVYGEDRSKLLYKWRVLGKFRILDNENVDDGSVGSVRFRRAHSPIIVHYEWY